jgi:TonB family protein
MKTVFPVILLIYFGFVPVLAQTQTCSLELSVLEFQKDQPAAEKPVAGAVAVLTDSKGKTIEASIFEGMPQFTALSEEKFTIIVSKVGFNKTVKEVNVDCTGLDENGSLSEIFFLFKGDSKQIHKMTAFQFVQGVKEEPANLNVKQADAVSQGILNRKSTNLVKPAYPPAARAVNASGAVNVQVTINELGNVVLAKVISGHPLLRAAAVKAARESKFFQTLLEGIPVKVTGIVVYNFAP